MDTVVQTDPAVRRFRAALTALYGPRLDRVVLFGSRARGEATADSDYDLAVFLRDLGPGMTEWYRLADLRTRFLEEGGPFFEAIPFPASAYDDRSALMHEIRRDGITL